MAQDKHPIPKAEFDAIFSRVPRLTVEVIVRNKQEAVYLSKRSIEPCKGQWSLPGGTVRFGEPLVDAVKRVALRELGVIVKQVKPVGYIEYPSHYEHGLDSPVGMAFEVTEHSGDPSAADEASDGGWFNKPPQAMHADQDEFLIRNGYLGK